MKIGNKMNGMTALTAVVAGIAVLALTGCSVQNLGTINQSHGIVAGWRDGFHVSGYKVGDLVAPPNSYPNFGVNYSFSATNDNGGSTSYSKQCDLLNRYATKLNKGKLYFYPHDSVAPDHAIVNCIADLKGGGTFQWNGNDGANDFAVILESSKTSTEITVATSPTYKVTVSTKLCTQSENEMGLCGDDPSLGYVPRDESLQKYVDAVGQYRLDHGIGVFSRTQFSKIGLPSKSSTAIFDPIVGSDGKVRMVHITWVGTDANWADPNQCLSIGDWNKSVWQIDDPGPSYPLMWVTSLADVKTSFGTIANGDCKKEPATTN